LVQLLVLLAVVGGDDEAPLAFGLLAETHGARALREDRRILGLACLEEVGDTRESSGDVARLGGLLRNARDDVAHRHARAVLEADERARRQRVHGRDLGSGEGRLLSLWADQLHSGTQILPAELLGVE